jgi:hypothetical protein
VCGPLARRREDGGIAETLAARFTDSADTRRAVEALQSAGVDGDDITLLSPVPGGVRSIDQGD